MKIRFTDVTTQLDGGQLKGLAASYEATDSDGLGNTGLDSGAISPSDSYPVFYADVATLESRTQTQLYGDFYPAETIQVVTGYQLNTSTNQIEEVYETQSVGEEWLISLQESLDLQIEIGKESRNPTIEIADEITDQVPIEINVIGGGSSGPGATPPSYFDDEVRNNMQQYVGEDWDGSVPSDVTLITQWNGFVGLGQPDGPIGPAGWDGDIGPASIYPARGNSMNLALPHNGEVFSSRFSFSKDAVNPFIKIGIVPPTGAYYQWHDRGLSVLLWMSSTPGGNPHMGFDGNPHMFKFDVDMAETFGTFYDKDLISVGYGLSERDGIRTSLTGASVVRQSRAPYSRSWETYMTKSGGDYVFPVIDKTYFLNWAMVRNPSEILERGTPPVASERKSMTGLSNQIAIMNMNGDYDIGGTNVHSLSNYLDVNYLQTPNPNQIYVGTDTTMHDFMWDSSSSFLSSTQYTPVSTSDINKIIVTNPSTSQTFSDLGFEADERENNGGLIPKWYYESEEEKVTYDIPQDGKLATIDFSLAYCLQDGQYSPAVDRKNSVWELMWTPHEDNTTRAWNDLGLTPVMWISPEPGGEPQPTHDLGKGVVIAIGPSTSTYYGQHLMSTNQVQSMTGYGSQTRATFAITNHKNYINVGVVESAVAEQLVLNGVAPTASQLRSWSITDPSLTYTASNSQVMYLNGKRQTVDIS